MIVLHSSKLPAGSVTLNVTLFDPIGEQSKTFGVTVFSSEQLSVEPFDKLLISVLLSV